MLLSLIIYSTFPHCNMQSQHEQKGLNANAGLLKSKLMSHVINQVIWIFWGFFYIHPRIHWNKISCLQDDNNAVSQYRGLHKIQIHDIVKQVQNNIQQYNKYTGQCALNNIARTERKLLTQYSTSCNLGRKTDYCSVKISSKRDPIR